MSESTDRTDGPNAARPDDERAAVDQATLEAAAVETYRASQGDGSPDASDGDGTDDGDRDGTADTDTDTQGAPATGDEATPDGDVAQPLGGTLSGEEDYVAASPAGLSGEQDAALAADVRSDDPEAGAHRGDIGANRGGSGGR
ncbi:hypothetical protein FRIG_13730 [Frigoribacterium faeni]|uniref:hypothetical protein n=1 Tax=Frigoribacterium faeni TaxID=145483 RepID=UPI001FAE3A40|nr:hypothetical protein [Frigoribacterium faeni]MCJ0702177.1 hypothetical protein [Frigoribacterium faeni]